MDSYQTYIFKSKYARFLEEYKRRERWDETVDRYTRFFLDRFPQVEGEILDARHDILQLKVMPSMRCLTTAGKALEEHNVAGYNCAYLPIDSIRAFAEIIYISMCGTGVGFSVESKYVNQLPEVPDELYKTDTCLVVSDSKVGWAKAYKELLGLLYAGQIPTWDVSRIRPRGSRLLTFGGRASGPDPLVALFTFTINTFLKARGRKLNSLECHDIACKIADIVVVGGVRRSALISLSDSGDGRMRDAKSGRWWESDPQRSFANNSVCYDELPALSVFLDEWSSLYESKSGERGVFSRYSAKRHLEKNVPRRDRDWDFGTNPCSEIILRPRQFCNLTEVVVRPEDTYKTLMDKVNMAVLLGTLQSTLTDFKFLSKDWKRNCEEERLLGVSMTGIMDNKALRDGMFLSELKEFAKEVNIDYSTRIGISSSAAITCVKPSGTVSQLCNTASGLHPHYSSFYVRRVRQNNTDPLTKFLIDQGVPHEPDVNKPTEMTVFSFPVRAPQDAITRNDVTAMDQLGMWERLAEDWCEHKPSATIYYTDNDFLEAGAWVYKNFEKVSGIAFLPKDDHSYQQAPYEEITEETYNSLLESFPNIRWEEFVEEEDVRESIGEMACTSDKCEWVSNV